MYSLLILSVSALLLALLFTPLARHALIKLGVVDVPDGQRKTHPKPIPRMGGIAVICSYFGAFAILIAADLRAVQMIEQSGLLIVRVIPAIVIILVLGMVDDIRGVRPRVKLAWQFLAAASAFWAGIRITNVRWIEADAIWWSLPLTLIWLVACMNAFNLIDGLDGLSTGVGIFAALATTFAALMQGNLPLAIATAPLAASLLGFLRYNFAPASIFLGDTGSLFIGFLLGSYSVLWSQKSATLFGMTAPLMAVALPLADTGIAVLRRFLRHRPLFSADAGHVHHRLLARGLSVKQVTLILYAVSGVAAGASLIMSAFVSNLIVGITIVMVALMFFRGIAELGYLEFEVAGRLFGRGRLRRMYDDQLELRTYEQKLSGTLTMPERLALIASTGSLFGVTHVQLVMDGKVFENADQQKVSREPCWTMHVPLTENDYMTVAGRMAMGAMAPTVLPFVELTRKALSPIGHGPKPTRESVAVGSA